MSLNNENLSINLSIVKQGYFKIRKISFYYSFIIQKWLWYAIQSEIICKIAFYIIKYYYYYLSTILLFTQALVLSVPILTSCLHSFRNLPFKDLKLRLFHVCLLMNTFSYPSRIIMVSGFRRKKVRKDKSKSILSS